MNKVFNWDCHGDVNTYIYILKTPYQTSASYGRKKGHLLSQIK